MPPENDPLAPPVDGAPPVAPPVDPPSAKVPPEANMATGLRTTDTAAKFDAGHADVPLGEFADQVVDVWIVDPKNEEQVLPVERYEVEEVNVGASVLHVDAQGARGDQVVRVWVRI